MVSARERKQRRLRVLVLLAAVLSGLLIGIIVIAATGGDKRPAVYAPFRAGFASRILERIDGGGPVIYPDPIGGQKSFYLDLDNGDLVALHVVLPGGDPDCAVQFDYDDDRRYEDCEGEPVEPDTLRRFPVTLEGDDDVVFVDLRQFAPDPPSE